MKRQQIINAIKTRMQGIKSANGYNTDIGNHVYVWRETPISANIDYALVCRETTDQISVLDNYHHLHELKVEIEVYSRHGNTTPEEINKILADILKAVNVDDTWGGIALFTLPASINKEINHTGEKIGTAFVTFLVSYRTLHWEI